MRQKSRWDNASDQRTEWQPYPTDYMPQMQQGNNNPGQWTFPQRQPPPEFFEMDRYRYPSNRPFLRGRGRARGRAPYQDSRFGKNHKPDPWRKPDDHHQPLDHYRRQKTQSPYKEPFHTGPERSFRKLDGSRSLQNDRRHCTPQQDQTCNGLTHRVSENRPQAPSSNSSGKNVPHARENLGYRGNSNTVGLSGNSPPDYQRNRRMNENEDDDDEDGPWNWLEKRKGEEPVNDKDQSPVSNEPLPGSEEARSNAIREETERLKQALKQNKKVNNVNLNELLSSGDESKSDNQSIKQKPAFTNLAQLELDASDMRAIAMASTEKASVFGEDSDDDIVEVERPPSPVHPVIDLDGSPTKDDNAHTLDDSVVDGSVVPFGKAMDISPTKNLFPEDSSKVTQNIQETHVTSGNRNTSDKGNFSGTNLSLSNSSQPVSLRTSSLVKATPTILDLSNKLVQETHCTTVENRSGLSSTPVLETNSQRVMESKNENRENIVNRRGSLNRSLEPTSILSSNDPGLTSPSRNPRRLSSSACQSPSPQRDSSVLQNKSTYCEPRGSPFLLRRKEGSHDARQKKIVNELQKLSQSKIKELINNPRSGKLESALCQLMKEHRAGVSRKSRDEAEKRIPVLNRKTFELPPDDTALLVDFAIDWSSLPGELISTLGDLFEDINSETDLSPSESQFTSTNVASRTSNEYDVETVFNSQNSEGEKTADTTLAETTCARIRVRQFARENLFPLEEDNGKNLHQTVTEIIKPVTPSECDRNDSQLLSLNTVTNSQDLANDVERRTKHISVKPASRNDIGSRQFRNNTHRTPLQLQSPNLGNESAIASDISVSAGVASKITSNESERVMTGVRKSPGSNTIKKNSSKHVNERTRMDTGKSPERSIGEQSFQQVEPACVYNSTKTKKKQKHKQKKFVHLEERSWFGNPPSEKSTHVRTDPPCNINEQDISTSSVESNFDEQPSASGCPVNAVESSEENNREVCRDSMNVGEKNGKRNAADASAARNVVSLEKQCVSMLPVLMMTVPADGLPDNVSNMTPIEMQRRIEEIDFQLQSLVQERYVLAQALKDENNRSAVTLNSTASQVVPINSPLSNQSDTVRSGKSMSSSSKRNDVDDGPSEECDTRKNKGRPFKRKSSDVNDAAPSKKGRLIDVRCQSKSVSNSSSANSELNSPDSVKGKPRKSRKATELIVLDGEGDAKTTDDNGDDDDDDEDDDDNNCSESTNSDSGKATARHLRFIPINGVEGNVLEMQVVDDLVYAASQCGLVYSISIPGKIQSTFGEKGARPVICIAVVKVENGYVLFTGSSDGILRVYDASSNKHQEPIAIPPKATYNISHAIHCLEPSWDILYIGTKAGSVVPYNIKKGTLGEPLDFGGHSILVLRCAMEGPRKILMAACRHQPVAIRDARSGLLLRTFGEEERTFYSLAIHNNLVFCGTNNMFIQVYDFQSGQLHSKLMCGLGIVEIKIVGAFIYCGCWDGSIHIYNAENHELLGVYESPGHKMVLSLAIFKKKLLCASKEHALQYTKKIPALSRYFKMQRAAQFSEGKECLESKRDKKKKKKRPSIETS